MDGSSLGTIPEDNRTVPGLKAGTHNFKAQKGRQFQPAQKSIEVTAGQTSELDLRLGSVLPVPVEISKRPPDSKVTYTRVGDSSVHDVTGTRLELPEGNYKFTANANGYLQKVANVAYLLGFRSDRSISHRTSRPVTSRWRTGIRGLDPERRPTSKERPDLFSFLSRSVTSSLPFTRKGARLAPTGSCIM